MDGFVHGRFQIVHHEHVDYIRRALQRCSFLWIGITQPDNYSLKAAQDAAVHRSEARENPLTYWERLVLLERVLEGIGRPPGTFRIVPFPIEETARLACYIPTAVTAFTTVLDDWNRAKIERLRNAGYRVEVLIERAIKRYSSSQIRALIRSGSPEWRGMVPDECAIALEEMGILERLTCNLPIGGISDIIERIDEIHLSGSSSQVDEDRR